VSSSSSKSGARLNWSVRPNVAHVTPRRDSAFLGSVRPIDLLPRAIKRHTVRTPVRPTKQGFICVSVRGWLIARQSLIHRAVNRAGQARLRGEIATRHLDAE